jgi:hypothetical protein
MNDLSDVHQWVKTNKFYINALVTIIVVGKSYYGLDILAILVQNNKHRYLTKVQSHQAFINLTKD